MKVKKQISIPTSTEETKWLLCIAATLHCNIAMAVDRSLFQILRFYLSEGLAVDYCF